MSRRLVFWGIGNICETCLKWNENIIPDFYIDEKSDCIEFHGKKVVRSKDIKEWNKLLVIITVIDDVQIKKNLNDKGLVEGVDFISYRDFFSADYNIRESLEEARNIKGKVGSYSFPILIVAPLFTSRQNNKMTNFFHEYIKNRKKDTFIIQTDLTVLSAEQASNAMEAEIISEPRLCTFDSPNVDKQKELCRYKTETIELTEQELQVVEEIEERKVSNTDDLRLSRLLYQYAKELINILNPKLIFIWGGWRRYSFILSKIATIKNIPHGFMEYGWLPGTFQFDPCGIAGQGICATKEKRCNVTGLSLNEERKISDIFTYITDNKLDTRKPHRNTDEILLLEQYRLQKRVTFIGMSLTGTGIRPGSEYWEKYISETFQSLEKAVYATAQICQKNSIQLVFKPHPDMILKEEFLTKLKERQVLLVKEIAIDSLIKNSDVVISMASAVDYKVLMYRKPLVKIGQTGMNGKNCTYEVKKSEDLESNILKAIDNGQTDEQYKNYKCYIKELLEKYLWDDLDQRPIRYGRLIDEDFLS